MPALHPFKLPDGRVVVPLDEVYERERVTVRGALILRGGWFQCRSTVIYVEEHQEAAQAT